MAMFKTPSRVAAIRRHATPFGPSTPTSTIPESDDEESPPFVESGTAFRRRRSSANIRGQLHGDTLRMAKEFETAAASIIDEWDAAQRPYAKRLAQLEADYRGLIGDSRVNFLVHECLEENKRKWTQEQRKSSSTASTLAGSTPGGSDGNSDGDDESTEGGSSRGSPNTKAAEQLEELLLAKRARPCARAAANRRRSRQEAAAAAAAAAAQVQNGGDSSSAGETSWIPWRNLLKSRQPTS